MGPLHSAATDKRNAMLMLLVCGALMIVSGFFGWFLGGISDGSRYFPQFVTRQSNPIKFGFRIVVTIAGGVILLIVGTCGLLNM
jgi:hypothetical protein